jgi:cysteine desulfurase
MSERPGSGERGSGAYPPQGFLDAASGQPLNPAAQEAWAAAADAGWADPRRLYREGRRAALLAEAAHEAVAALIGVRPDEITFTTDPALPHVIDALLPSSSHRLVVSAVEHSAVLAAGDRLEARGGQMHVVGVDRTGRVDLEDYAAALRDAKGHSTLGIIQTANHEVGTRQPVAAIAAACAAASIPLAVDASMTMGREDTPADWSILTGRSSTWGGPPGLGVVAVRRGLQAAPLDLPSAPLPAVLAAARGLEWADARRRADAPRMRALTDSVRNAVSTRVPDIASLGADDDRLDYLTAFSCLFVDGEALVLALDEAGYAISSGSSCVSDLRRPSHVLAAMGVLTQGNVRVSLPLGVSDDTVTGFIETLPTIIGTLRAMLDVETLIGGHDSGTETHTGEDT